MKKGERRLNPTTQVPEVWNGSEWERLIPTTQNFNPYRNYLDRLMHLQANAQNVGLPEGSLFEYEKERKARAGSIGRILQK